LESGSRAVYPRCERWAAGRFARLSLLSLSLEGRQKRRAGKQERQNRETERQETRRKRVICGSCGKAWAADALVTQRQILFVCCWEGSPELGVEKRRWCPPFVLPFAYAFVWVLGVYVCARSRACVCFFSKTKCAMFLGFLLDYYCSRCCCSSCWFFFWSLVYLIHTCGRRKWSGSSCKLLFVVPRAYCTALLLLLLYYQCVVDKPKRCDVIPLFLCRGLSRIGFFFFFCVIFHTLFGSVSRSIGSIKDTSAAKVLSRRRLRCCCWPLRVYVVLLHMI